MRVVVSPLNIEKIMSSQDQAPSPELSSPHQKSTGPLSWVRSLYDWTLSWAETPHGFLALCSLSFIEAIFFPIPPDVLLIALTLGSRARWFKFALGCTIASVLGGLVGYTLGAYAWEGLQPLFYTYIPGFTEHKFETIKSYYNDYDFWVVFTAGFTPIPFKVITVSAGACAINLPIFIVASALSRGARFFLVAWLLKKYGEPIRLFIERRFNLLTLIATALLIGGFALIKLL